MDRGREQFFIQPLVEESDSGKAVVFTLKPGEMLPQLPPSGLVMTAGAAHTKGSLIVDLSNFPGVGPDAKLFAYTKMTANRNLFRISLRK
jgi:hypothetical protein